jgi:hypothetical protein
VGALRDATSPILPSEGWKNLGDGAGFYGCSQIELPTAGFVPSTLRYPITGSANDRVDKALISAFHRFTRRPFSREGKAQKRGSPLVKWTRNPLPPGLTTAIDAGLSFASESGFSVRYVVERCGGSLIKQPDGSSYRCTTMDLTISP